MNRNHLTEFELYIEDISSAIDEMMVKGSLAYETRIRAGVRIKDDVFKKGYVNVYLPIPLNSSRVHEGMILGSNPSVAMYALDNHRQRTAFFSEYLEENRDFEIEYAYEYEAEYIDVYNNRYPDTKQPEFSDREKEIYRKHADCDCGAEHAGNIDGKEPEPRVEDVAEDGKSIIFTNKLKELCGEITGNCTCNFDKAMAIYDYITKNIEYSFVDDYIKLDNITEYAVIHKYGDCGLLSLLFIILCRIAGIPARWQSGLFVPPKAEEAGSHDWAMFYIAPYGWLYADCAFGSLAFEALSKNEDKCEEKVREIDYEKIRRFYFGNMDPFRMPANSAFEKPFYPAKQFVRADPYDNQCGEIEYEDRGLSFDEYSNWKRIIQQNRL